MKPTLQTYYQEKGVPDRKEQLGLKNINEVPKLEKIVVTSHVGHYMNDRKAAVEDASAEICKITGQKPSVVFARKSVANFKVREGEAVGARVTLRGNHMWEFLDRFVHVTAPNVRDFRGFSPKSFDGRGNYAMGLKEQIIFPEISYDQIEKVRGMDIIVTTTANTDEEAKELLRLFGFPYPAEEAEEQQAA